MHRFGAALVVGRQGLMGRRGTEDSEQPLPLIFVNHQGR